jgi:hypothetical protein
LIEQTNNSRIKESDGRWLKRLFAFNRLKTSKYEKKACVLFMELKKFRWHVWFALYFRKHTMIRITYWVFFCIHGEMPEKTLKRGNTYRRQSWSAAGGIRSDVLFRGGRAAAQAEVGDEVLALVDGLAVVAGGGLLAVLASRVAPAGRHVGAEALRWELPVANSAVVAARPLCSDARKD